MDSVNNLQKTQILEIFTRHYGRKLTNIENINNKKVLEILKKKIRIFTIFNN